MLAQASDAYSRLAAGIRLEEWSAVEQAHEGKSTGAAFLIPNLSPLGVERAAADHWAAILLGLRKLSDEAYTPGSVTNGVVPLAQLSAMAAHAKFASGERHGGVTLLLDGLKMAWRIRPLSAPISAQCETPIFKAIAGNLESIPLLECDRIRTALDPVLLDPALSRKERAELALLRLHMRVEAYRWKYMKLPGRLSDAAPAGEIEDPETKRPVKFEITTAGYRLLSEEYGALGAG